MLAVRFKRRWQGFQAGAITTDLTPGVVDALMRVGAVEVQQPKPTKKSGRRFPDKPKASQR